MRSVLPLLLLPLLAGASKPERVDRHLQVGPLVASVVSGSKTLEPEGDFFRAVLANSEYDACLRVERVNVRVPNAPRIKESRRYCAVTLGKARLSLAADDQQEAELSNLSWKEFDAAAPPLGLTVVSIPLDTPGDVEHVFAVVRETRPQALLIPQTVIIGRVYKEIAAFAIAERLPTITTSNVFAREGLLMSYGSDLGSIWRLAAHYTDQLLRGAKAADLPVQLPTRYELVLNLRTARGIGKEPPETLLARADEVIE